MTEYTAPIADMRFVLRELVGIAAIARLPAHADFTEELASAVLEEAGRFATGVLSPLNRIGDQRGALWDRGVVTTAPGWREAYTKFASDGWIGLSCNTLHGGQGLPRVLAALTEEMWNGANMAFGLCPMLSRGAIEAIELAGTAELKQAYLPRLISGEWTGTMNLTESQAGSDLGAINTRAVLQGDGSYRLFGQKIFITYGEHDLTANIVHMVLARAADAPPGIKGLSLFMAPKFQVDDKGMIGARNDIECVSIEHKLGIHGSPTATLGFGAGGNGAVAHLVGEANRGLEYMFIMMNAARFAVGIEGIGIAQRAYDQARRFACERVQGTVIDAKGRRSATIVHHPDVLRMLLTMKSTIEAMRALAAVVAAALDRAQGDPHEAARQQAQAFAELMIPVVKGWSTESAIEIASLNVQIHGGMGYIEETGAAQLLRDARITSIYEGTTGIQANDLTGRKLMRDHGQTLEAVLREMRQIHEDLRTTSNKSLIAIAQAFGPAIDALGAAKEFLVADCGDDPRRVAAGAVPFLKLLGIVAGGWQMARAALKSAARLDEEHTDAAFHIAKIATARFYADQVLPSASGLAHAVKLGSAAVLAYDIEQL